MSNIKRICQGLFFAGLSLAPLFAAQAQWMPGSYAGTNLPAGSIFGIVEAFLMWLLGIFSFIAIIGFVISGILYLTAAGDTDQQEKAKKALIYSIIGVIVGLAGLVILFAVSNILNASTRA